MDFAKSFLQGGSGALLFHEGIAVFVSLVISGYALTTPFFLNATSVLKN